MSEWLGATDDVLALRERAEVLEVQRDALAHALRELLTKGQERWRHTGSEWLLPASMKAELSLVVSLNAPEPK